MAKDWAAVAEAITARMDERGVSQKDLAATSGVSVAWLRRLQKAEPGDRGAPLLAAVSTALGWPPNHLNAIALGDDSRGSDPVSDLREEIAAVRATLADVQERLDHLESRG